MKEKVLKCSKLDSKDGVLLDICFFCFGFVISFAKIAGFMSPFCLSLSMALRRRPSIFSLFGSIFGVALFLTADNIIYIFILLIAMCLKFVFNFNGSLKNGIFSSISFLIPQIISIVMFPVGFGTLLTIYFESILCGIMAALFTQSSKKFSVNLRFKGYDVFGVFILAVVFLISFCNINFIGFNVGRIIAIFFIIQAFLLYGFSYACVSGVIITIGFALFTKDFAKFGVVLAVSGFMAGIFRYAGKVFQIIMFFTTYIFCCIFFGGLNVQSVLEVFLVCFVNALLPKKYLLNIFSNAKAQQKSDRVKLNDEISLKLKFAANVILDLKNSVSECAKVMDSLVGKGFDGVYENVAENLCRGCRLNTNCWVNSYGELSRSFCYISNFLKENGSITIQDMPVFLKNKCFKLQNLVQHLNFAYKEYLCNEQNSRRINEARAIAAEQFSGMVELLYELSGEVASIKSIDSKNSNIIKNILKSNDIVFKGIFCFLDEFQRLTVDVYVDLLMDKDKLEKLTLIISRAIGKDMEFPTVTKAFQNYKISFFESAVLGVDFAAVQATADGGKYCGDTYDYFMDGRGFAHIILSDGMGSGKRASLDSLMTCSTLRKFIEAGFGFNSALKLLNLSFAIKSKEESLATIDTCTIDLYTGQTNFLKAGATTSYIFSRGYVTQLHSKSLPIGIIQGIGFDSENVTLFKGDVIVMLSDGVICDPEWISKTLKSLYTKNAKDIASELLKMAKTFEDKDHLDDITVLVAKII